MKLKPFNDSSLAVKPGWFHNGKLVPYGNPWFYWVKAGSIVPYTFRYGTLEPIEKI
jgi:hypothetical protein